MRCPQCGAASEVSDTRPAQHGLVVRRARKCFNEHRFVTYEAPSAAYTSSTPAVKRAVDAVLRRWARRERDKGIRRALKTLSYTQTAAKFGVSKSLVWRVALEKDK